MTAAHPNSDATRLLPGHLPADLIPYAIAKLRTEDNLSQVQIAQRLGLSQGYVSKLLTELRNQKVIARVTVVAANYRESPRWQQMLDLFENSAESRTALQALSPYGKCFRLEIARSDLNEPDGFAKAAAPLVHQLLRGVSHLGISCGSTIAAINRELRPLLPTLKDRLHVVPVVGEPTHLSNVDQSPENSATNMAESLREALGASGTGAVLRGVAAYIPRKRRGEIMEFFHTVPGYRVIFGGQQKSGDQPEIDQLNCIVTGAGIVSSANPKLRGTLIKERLAQENLQAGRQKIDPIKLEQLVYGDLAGILIPRAKLGRADVELVRSLNEGLTGLRRAHLERICQLADGVSSPGVILIAFGQQKRELIREIVRLGLVTTLGTTPECARQLIA